MKRKLVFAGLCYLAGLFSASFIFTSSSYALILTGIFLAASAVAFRKNLKMILLSALLFLIGFIYFTAFFNTRALPVKELIGKEISFTGTVMETDEYHGDVLRYHVKGKINGNIPAKLIILSDGAECSLGDGISFAAILSEPSANTYLTPISYEESNGVFADAKEIESLEITRKSGLSPARAGARYKEYITKLIRRYLPTEEGTLVISMLCGEKQGLSEESKINMYRSGIGHLTAVSGAHMMIFLMLLRCVFPKGKLPLALNAALTAVAVLTFVFFAGFSPSVLRAAFFIFMILFSDFAGRKSDFPTTLVLAAVVLTIGNPAEIWNPSYLLSFAGTWGIGCLAPEILKRMKKNGYLSEMLITSFSASFAALILSALYFPELSPSGPLFSVILTPLCTAVLFCGFVVAVTGGITIFAAPLLIFAGFFSKIILYASALFGKLSFLNFPAGYGWVAPAVIIAVLMIILSVYKLRSIKTIGVVFIISVIMLYSGSAIFGALSEYYTYAVRFPDSYVIHKGGSAVLLDYGGGRDFYNVRQYMQSKGLRKVSIYIQGGNENKAAEICAEQLAVFNFQVCGFSPEIDVECGTIYDTGGRIIYEYGKESVALDKLAAGTELILDDKGFCKERRARYAGG